MYYCIINSECGRVVTHPCGFIMKYIILNYYLSLSEVHNWIWLRRNVELLYTYLLLFFFVVVVSFVVWCKQGFPSGEGPLSDIDIDYVSLCVHPVTYH